MTPVTIEQLILEDRLNKIVNKGKSSQGVIRKLQRQIRNIQK